MRPIKKIAIRFQAFLLLKATKINAANQQKANQLAGNVSSVLRAYLAWN
jgi:hypothetical protein